MAKSLNAALLSTAVCMLAPAAGHAQTPASVAKTTVNGVTVPCLYNASTKACDPITAVGIVGQSFFATSTNIGGATDVPAGMLKGGAGAVGVAAAAAGIDYVAPNGAADALTIGGKALPILLTPGTAAGTLAAGNDPRFPASVMGLRKGGGAGSADVPAIAGADYVAGNDARLPASVTGLRKGAGAGSADVAAVPGTDYQVPGAPVTANTGDVTASQGNVNAPQGNVVAGGVVQGRSAIIGTGGLTTAQPFLVGQNDASAVSAAFARQIGRPGMYNNDPMLLHHWRTSLGYMRTNAGTPRVAIVGDSTDFGFSSGLTNPATTRDANSVSARVAALLTQQGIFPAQSENWFGNCNADAISGNTGGLPTYDERVVITGSPVLGNTSICGSAYELTSPSSIQYTSKTNIDSIDLYYNQNAPFNGVFTYAVDGGTPVPVTSNASGASAVVKVPVAGLSAAPHSVKLTWVSGSPLLLGVDMYSQSTGRKVDIVNLGWYGGFASAQSGFDGNSSAIGPEAMLVAISPNLTVIRLGINDYVSGIQDPSGTTETPGFFSPSVQHAIYAAQLTGDVVLATTIPSNPGSAALAKQQAFNDAIRALAAVNNIPLIDINQRWGGQTPGGGYAYMGGAWYSDSLHPSPLGYDDIARFYAMALFSGM